MGTALGVGEKAVNGDCVSLCAFWQCYGIYDAKDVSERMVVVVMRVAVVVRMLFDAVDLDDEACRGYAAARGFLA